MSIKHYKIKSRYYVTDSLAIDKDISLDSDTTHHLYSVLRAKKGDNISIFNPQDGEFIATIVHLEKKNISVHVVELISTYKQPVYSMHLAYAPLKKDVNDFVLEKSTELGVNEITNIITHRTVNKAIPCEKMTKKVIVATQQCGRIDIPLINPALSLEKFLQQNIEKTIMWLNEFKIGHALSYYLQTQSIQHPIFLIGPEGGFNEQEKLLLSQYKNVLPTYLHTNILRAETACVATLINFMIINCNF